MSVSSSVIEFSADIDDRDPLGHRFIEFLVSRIIVGANYTFLNGYERRLYQASDGGSAV